MKHSLLTNAKVKDIAERGFHLDGAGLYLQVSKYDTKSWVFRYTMAGRVRDMGLGACPPITLAQARKLAAEQREHLIRGDDPLELRQAKKDRARSDELASIIFRDAAKKFIALHAPTWKNEKHRAQWGSTLEQYAYRSLGSRRAAEITGADITDALHPIWMSKQETASRVKQRIERVCQWVKDGMPLPQQGAAKRVEHHKAMPLDDLPDFMQKLRGRVSTSARALELAILTATRTNEVIGAKWDEIDLKAKVWTIPADRMKASKEHTVPLSDRAIALLTSLERVKGEKHVFVGAKAGQGLSNMAMLEQLRGLAGNGYTVHGFRSTFRDWAGDRTNFARDVIEHALAHRIKDKAEAAYRRTDALEKRRKLMEAWARFCEAPVIEGGNVKTLRRA